MPRTSAYHAHPDLLTTTIVAFALLLLLGGFAPHANAQTISVDPETHEIVPVSPTGDPTNAAVVTNGAFVAAPSALAPVTSVIEGGGVVVELNGAFRSSFTGTVDSAGNSDSGCTTSRGRE